ncbi:MAG TPA: urease accessory protein UreD [Methylomirabilota bacterium]|jgi:urease accessory protein|nr:urease accessory protein UreD [Methylomirabilota bacterium]
MLRLAFERRGRRTVLTERRFTLPLQALECIELDGSGVGTVMLLNPTGGVVGGDVLETSVSLGPGSRVCLTTPSATRVYRTAGPPAVQRFRATLGEGAQLEYLPGHLIPSPGARLKQTTEVTLAPGARLLLVDAWAIGRVAREERWRFDELDLGLAVSDERGLLLRERCLLDGVARDGLGGTEGFPYVASFAAFAPTAESWEDLARELSRSVDGLGDGTRVGVTVLGRGGLLSRLLCPSAPALDASIRALWACCRTRLLGLPPLDLRKF